VFGPGTRPLESTIIIPLLSGFLGSANLLGSTSLAAPQNHFRQATAVPISAPAVKASDPHIHGAGGVLTLTQDSSFSQQRPGPPEERLGARPLSLSICFTFPLHLVFPHLNDPIKSFHGRI
jgi:hypothetical protein